MRIVLLTLLLVTFTTADDLVVVIGGELGSNREVRAVAQSFSKESGIIGMPIKYKSRKGIETCQKNLRKSLNAIDYTPYDKVHFLCFILGGMSLSPIFDEVKPENMGRVVVVKGPVEEALPRLSPYVYPQWTIDLMYGQTVSDIAASNYKSFADGYPVGMIIETVPNPLAFHVKKKMVKKFGDTDLIPLSMEPDSLFEGFTDHFFIHLHHNDLYKYPEKYKSEVLHYFSTGSFTAQADRTFEKELLFFPQPQ